VLKKKKPDQVVWDEAQEEYIARLLPYAAQASGPVIQIPNVDAFKQKGVEKVSKQLQSELEELQSKIKAFVKSASDTQKVYTAKFKFEPIVGETYFLYEGEDEDYLSLIAPDQWQKKFIGAFRLSSEYKWEQVER
jgi:vacuolar-type H+-ATPase subunit I/STV1